MDPFRRTRKSRTSCLKLLQQLCTDTGCSQEYQAEVMEDRDGWRERESERERELGKSVRVAWHDDDDDDEYDDDDISEEGSNVLRTIDVVIYWPRIKTT